MRILETPWEKRNLNVNGVEYYFEHEDNASDIPDYVLNDTTHDYQVAHLPVNEMEIHNTLNKHGFVFSETKFELIADLKRLELPIIFSRYEQQLDYHKVDSEDELEQIYTSMKNGVFDTDKIALDPKLGIKKSGNRYATWSKQIIEDGIGFPYIVTLNGENMGFFILKKASEKLGDSFLAALFDNEKYGGFGFSVLYYPMLVAKKMGLKKMVTGVSSNNPSSVKMHLALGYQIKNLYYVMTKHIEI